MTSDQRPVLSDRASRLRMALIEWPRRRVPLQVLWQILDGIDPATRTFLHRRQLLADTLAELAAAHAIDLPAQASYDRTELPALPRFVTLPDRTAPLQQPAAPIVWHPALSWAADAAITTAQRRTLEKINRWLFTSRGNVVAPQRERSLEILGDEKALDRLQTTGLFGPGRLTLDLLRARRVTPPLHTAHTGDGPVLLVVENSDTFDSLHRVLDTQPTRVGLVAWGAGGAFEASVLSIRTLGHSVSEIAYFGDLDYRGLQIPSNANRLSAAYGQPSVRPAVGLYSALQRAGTYQDGQPPLTAAIATQLSSWLEPQHREWAVTSLVGGTRVAQEAVGLAYITENDDWLVDLV
ncbi:DUF2399 domain-containing protein [Actinoplanes sp. TBRC 11911]|uniref:Wadjet anti-phage system protein JetD domain-containing protein n=1 Tax=Actinoplanes sp. TBRC 11911 TaxID=2729386 RepID=UPI00145E90FA|nr:DUF2399 domain-containing protein [Actinoplanes sp. TBRC 11911]NMO54537.1 DUF2399 domain-containing protein [Actinoplanes sp. TBRC 11911]